MWPTISSSNVLFSATGGFPLGWYSMSMYFSSGGASDVLSYKASISSLPYLSLANWTLGVFEAFVVVDVLVATALDATAPELEAVAAF